MNIGMIVYSQTGHTLSVAVKLKEKLSAAGHTVSLEQLETVEAVRMYAANAQLKTKPEIDTYDALVFGCPVQGGAPAPPMGSYLEQITSLQGKKSRLFGDRRFPPGMGSKSNDRPDGRDLRIQRRDGLRLGECGLVVLGS